jgi:hypothetical protein
MKEETYSRKGLALPNPYHPYLSLKREALLISGQQKN